MDGRMGTKVDATVKLLVICLSTKWRQSYSSTYGYIWSRFTIKIVSSTDRCIQGYRVPASSISTQRPQLEGGAYQHLYR